MERVIDASGQVAGRLSSLAAKALLKGDEIVIINAERAVVSGRPVYTERMFKEKRDRGDPYHGPFYPREPDRILRRMVRGMLPFHTARGREAFRRLIVYKSLPAELAGKKTVKNITGGRPVPKKMELGEISLKLGVKKRW